MIGFRHRFAIGRRVHDRRRDGIYQYPILGDLLGERHGECGDASLRDSVGGHACAAAPFQRRSCRDVDDAATLAAREHGIHRCAAAEKAGGEIVIDLRHQRRLVCLCDLAPGKATGEMNRGPGLYARIKLGDLFLIREV